MATEDVIKTLRDELVSIHKAVDAWPVNFTEVDGRLVGTISAHAVTSITELGGRQQAEKYLRAILEHKLLFLTGEEAGA